MDLGEIKSLVASPSYDFLRDDYRLGKNIILLTVAGSHAYGTNHVGSDLDIRGAATNDRFSILTMQDFEHVRHGETDTIIYSFDKLVKMLCSGNPNVIEMLGLRPEHYLLQTKVGSELLARKDMFLSRRIADSFGGFAASQMKIVANDTSAQKCQKAMMHAFRALSMGIEIMQTGQVNTYRSDKELSFLKAVLHGEYSEWSGKPTEVCIQYYQNLQNQLRSERWKSALPENVDRYEVDKFRAEVNGERWGGTNEL